jgi:chromosome segregation and condensation protein ScpB/DNA-binding XRE family transcriptional regulator
MANGRSQSEIEEAAGHAGLGAEIRRQRLLRHWSQARLAKEAKVARTTLNEVEGGRRFPSIATYARLREALGLEAAPTILIPRREPATVTDGLVRRLCATLIAARRLPLADLAAALDIAIPACRELLLVALPRFGELGCTVTQDGAEVAVGYVEDVADAVRRVTVLDDDIDLSSEQLAILALLAVHGPLTRTQIEEYRGEGSETLLRRLAACGVLARARDEKEVGAPYLYRLTAKALGLIGVPTVEALRARVLETVAALPPAIPVPPASAAEAVPA